MPVDPARYIRNHPAAKSKPAPDPANQSPTPLRGYQKIFEAPGIEIHHRVIFERNQSGKETDEDPLQGFGNTLKKTPSDSRSMLDD
jgi:hypothetical protein